MHHGFRGLAARDRPVAGGSAFFLGGFLPALKVVYPKLLATLG